MGGKKKRRGTQKGKNVAVKARAREQARQTGGSRRKKLIS